MFPALLLHYSLLFSTIIMRTTNAQIPIRLLTHNIRYATTSPFKGEKPWADRKQLLLNELYFNTLYNPESFICLQEVLHQQLVDVMDGLNGTSSSTDEWTYIGVGRDDGKEKGEYSPIIFKPTIWELKTWKTVWLSETPEVPGKGWDAASVRIVTVGTFQHKESKKEIVGMCTHLDDQGEKSRTESAKLILKTINDATKTNSSGNLPVFLGGDLNSEPSGSAYQILNGKNSTLQDVDETIADTAPSSRYKTAAQISQKVLQEVSGWLKEDANVVELCERGDKVLAEEISKVYKGKKISKGIGHCTTISPSSYITPYTPLKSDAEEAATTLKKGEWVKIQLGAQIDGFASIVCDSVLVGASGEISGREADLYLATYYANELLLRLMLPPGVLASGTEEEKKKAAAQKPYTQTKITQLLEKVVAAYDCNLVESTTIWLFDRNEIEAKKKIILAAGEGVKGEGLPEVGEAWGVEMGVSLGSGKVKTLSNRATLHRRTATTYGLKRPTSRAILSEVVKKFGTFPFSLRQLDDEKAAKVGVVECVRGGVLRQYEVVGDKNNDPVARLFTTIAITKNGITRLAAPPTPDLSKFKTDKKITDEEILKILEQPIGKTTTKNKNRKKKKKIHASVAMPSTTTSLRKRKSRTSTPFGPGDDAPSSGSEPKRQKTQSSLDGWVEPPVKGPAASFEEHGFARHGVLEQMYALGTHPSSKVKQRTRAMGDAPPRQALPVQNGGRFAPEEAVSTPEMTPAPEVDRDESDRLDDDEIQVAAPMQDEEEDDDYIPTSKSKAVPRPVKTPVRGKTPVGNKTPAQAKTPVRNGTSKTATPLRSPATQNALPPPSIVMKQRIQIGVNDAIQRSKTAQRAHVGAALKEMHDDSQTDPKLFAVLGGIMHQNNTQEQYTTFRRFIKDAKKRFKKTMKIHSAQESPAHVAPTFTALNAKASAGAHDLDAAPSPSSSPDDVIMVEDEELPAGKSFAHGSEHPLSTAPALLLTRSPSPPTSRMSPQSPTKQHPDLDADVGTSKAPTPQEKSSPSGGEGSDSDLSDVNEEIVQNGPPEPTKGNGHATGAAAKKARLAALARASKAKKANAHKGTGKYEKKQPPSAKDIEEELELQAKRAAMAENQPARLSFINPPTSDVRFDDDLLETESLTESQIAVGPPIDLDRQRRPPGRVQRNGTLTLHLNASGKRMREENSAFPSPQPESAATTRPTTPALMPPGPKRLKLTNGQAARTKRSPVKNRDGPIAGIAHQGGGGLRPLGPDDNDPGSPPSESDDWCGACKGAGEFVCCEGCPRVFHFLCLDPPRGEAPDGSFLCNECTARLKPSEEHVARSFKSLGALFKQLESTNPRAFALPSEIRNFYLDIEARPDGSYFEKTRKFPLAKSSGYGYQKPDYFKTTDSNHKTVLCCQCGKTSGGKRPMLQCDYCHAYWHLDCVDPPLANPPHVSLEASQRDAWMCPRHIEHDFRSGRLLQNDLNAVDDDDIVMSEAGAIPRLARKVRQPRKSSIIEPAFARGTRNNGLIDIINDPDDETDGEGNYVFSPHELDESKDRMSKVFRIAEKGVILDFVSKVKQDRRVKLKQERREHKAAVRRQAARDSWAARPIDEQQTALHLTQLAKKEKDIGLNTTNVDALILSLTAEAPNEVLTAIAEARPKQSMTVAKRAKLWQLQKLIQRALEEPAVDEFDHPGSALATSAAAGASAEGAIAEA
ncbi:hypothetical protein BDV96DRAFT_612741 [Lophiotrema nucula]|uniref:PHD-type domain-containing protein n=1 Tax=Lophiotrema nucula TaxID=690887 RepID=A0A6A5Z979_9PLEO|nr:hypothetical protein BDV96DRAFT_612741 [Lophiotrema nucula]